MKTLFATWTTTLYGTIGIGLVEDPERKELLIRALPVMGLNQKTDEKEIAELGAVIPVPDLKKMIELVDNYGNKNKRKIG